LEVKTKKTWTLSEATRWKQSIARRQREKQPNPGFRIKVWDLVENQTIIYSSCRETARALNINRQAILNYLNRNQTKPHKKKIYFY
jgi:hypothetical protein